MKNVISKLQYIIIITLIISSCKKNEQTNSKYEFSDNESKSIKIGLFLDYAVWDVCKTTTINMLNAMKCNYTILNKDSILEGNLNHYNILLMPGGDMWKYKDDLTSIGMSKITEFVNQGGGYIGICGGAYFAASKIVWRGWANEPRINVSINGLNLFKGTSDGPIEYFAPSYVDSKSQIKIIDSIHAITNEVQSSLGLYYDHGPMFIANENSDMTIIGKTVNGNKDVIIAFHANTGKVFLIALHPERDDSHVSWIMIKNAMIWCNAK